VRSVFGKKTVYCNDIGCYTLGFGEPLDSCDVLLCMGSSISQASGIARTTGKRTVAYIGDSTFFHSGLPALLNAVKANDPITVVILDNHVTAMTGFQPSPASGEDRLRFSWEKAVRGLGVQEVFTVDPFDEKEALSLLKKAKAGTGTNVVISSAPCVVADTRSGTRDSRQPYTVEPELCNSCSLCIRVLGCPAIHVEGDRYTIDQALCDGCALCAYVCNQDAIQLAGESP
jgi:indolepyruvate ferredoxin oxidoreductase alpha subunit